MKRCNVTPTLLTWPGSAIVHDIKGENWHHTAGWRARFGRALLFDPTNPRSAAYNPLLEVRRGGLLGRTVGRPILAIIQLPRLSRKSADWAVILGRNL